MKIDGYEELPLTDGAALLADPLFWPTFFSYTMASSEPERVAEAFGVDEPACRRYFKRLIDPAAWPVFRIGLSGGHEVDLVFRNEPGDSGTEWFLCRSGGAHALALANVGGHEFGPGLSWGDLMTAANRPGATPGVAEPDARLLLLLPAFGDADLAGDAVTVVAAALKRYGAGSGADDLAAWFLEDPQDWPHWRLQEDGVLVCDDRYSRRNPRGPVGHPLADLREISSALAAG